MKKYLLLISFLILIPIISLALSIVPSTCQDKPCELKDVKPMIDNVIDFIKNTLVPSLAILFFIIGGLLFIFSGANPQWQALAKRILLITTIGAFLVYGATAIIKFVIDALGANIKIN